MYPTAPKFAPKIEGETCHDCGQGKYIKNPKTGKIFCDQKCWLTPQEQKVESIKKEQLEERKSEGQQLGNAKTNAVNIVIALYNKGEVKQEEIEGAIQVWTEKIFKIDSIPF